MLRRTDMLSLSSCYGERELQAVRSRDGGIEESWKKGEREIEKEGEVRGRKRMGKGEREREGERQGRKGERERERRTGSEM